MTRQPRIGIIGSGFGGLAAAIELKRGGYDDLVILERADDVGGVWRENTYPGAACDIPSPYYSFSYEPNPRWPRRFSRQPAILDYLRDIVDTYDLRRHIRFGAEVTTAEFVEDSGTWSVTTDDGGSVEVDVLVPAVGQLSRPAWPDIPGRDRFAGAAFHSAQWDHDVDLAGQRVAVIGTGASAVQFIPQIQPAVGHLTVLQRSAPYVIPRPDARFTERHHAVFARMPWTQRLERGGWWAVTEALGTAFLHSDVLARVVTGISRAHMRHQVRDPDLFAKVWPDYPIGCKRVLFSSDYLPALTRPNVDLVTEKITEITPAGVLTGDGVLHEADVLIYATGFAASDFLAPMRIHGLGGRELSEPWSGGARAYLGMTVPDFPNLLLMYGPNTNVGAGSIIFMLEAQARYLRQYVDAVVAAGAPLVVRPEVEATFDAETQRLLGSSVWTRCSSWYRGPDGRISSNWPHLTIVYRRRTAALDPADYAAVT